MGGAPANQRATDRAGWVRLWLFGLLYFSEGAPIGFVWWALPTWLRSQGVPVGTVTSLTAALVLPWTLKFLWAPLADALAGTRFGRRSLIVLAQLGMGASLLPLFALDPVTDASTMGGLLLVHAFFAATQDVAIDGYALETVPPSQHGRLNGVMQAGMLLGRALFGGPALLVAERLGMRAVLGALLGAVWFSLAGLLLSPSERPSARRDANHAYVRQRWLGPMRRMLSRKESWIAGLFALTGATAFEVVGGLRGPYLVDRDVSSTTIAWLIALPSTLAMLAGGLLGGWLSDRNGAARATGGGLLFVLVVVAALAGSDGWSDENTKLVLLVVLYAGVGVATAASYALFMGLSDPRAGATQFSLFMALTNACEAWSVWGAGKVVESSGYAWAFAAAALTSLLSLPLLIPLSGRRGPSRTAGA